MTGSSGTGSSGTGSSGTGSSGTGSSGTGSSGTGAALASLRDRVATEVGRVVVGQEEVVDLLLAAAVVGGHVLLEGVPGVAKTLLARASSAALGLDFRRVQFTPD